LLVESKPHITQRRPPCDSPLVHQRDLTAATHLEDEEQHRGAMSEGLLALITSNTDQEEGHTCRSNRWYWCAFVTYPRPERQAPARTSTPIQLGGFWCLFCSAWRSPRDCSRPLHSDYSCSCALIVGRSMCLRQRQRVRDRE
jgi:hypothetical protein